MTAEWFCNISGKTLGPLSARQLRTLVKQGKLTAEHQVRQGAKGMWVPADRVKGLFAGSTSQANSSDPNEIPVAKPVNGASKLPAIRPGKTKPTEQPPVATPVRGTKVPQARVPRARAPAVPPPAPRRQAAAAASDPFGIVAEENSPTARVTGRGVSGPAAARKRQKNNKLVVGGLAVLLVALVIAAVLLKLLPRNPAEAPDQHAAGPPRSQQDPDAALEGEGSSNLDAANSGKPASAADLAEAGSSEPADQPAEDKWIDASKSAIERGDVRVKIISAVKGFPKLSAQLKNPEEQLILTIDLYNRNSRRKLDYSGWGQRARINLAVKLTDDAENLYHLKTYVRVTVEGQLTTKSIYPRESIQDILVFERPIDDIEYLRLELPAGAFGEPGMLYFKIPKEMISQQDAITEEPSPEDLFGDDDTPDDGGDDHPPDATAGQDGGGGEDTAPVAEEPAPEGDQGDDKAADEQVDQLRKDYPDLFDDDDGGSDQNDGFEGKFPKFQPKG